MINRILVFSLSYFAKFLAFFSRVAKKGSGTSLPGYVVEKYFQSVLKVFNKDFDEVILITGTNGKTTTRAVLVDIYKKNGIKVCTNKGGANIYRGIASSLLLNTNWLGRSRSKVAILEVEEATLPKLTKNLKPTKLVLTNIFRDQLDAYGEIDKTLEYFKIALAQGGVGPVVYVNYDDKKLLECLSDYNGKIIGFSIGVETGIKYEKSTIKTKLNFKNIYFAKNYRLAHKTQIVTVFDDNSGEKIMKLETILPGVYNLANAVAASLVAMDKIKVEVVVEAVRGFGSVFGRGEVIHLNGKKINLFLIKNPAGFDGVLNYIEQRYGDDDLNMAILINDKIADGKDVSWLWDIDLEGFFENQSIATIRTSGTRGLDMLLRLEYADFDVTEEDYKETYTDLIDSLVSTKADEFIVLCTYTALMELRKELSKITKVADISEDGN